MIFGEYMIGVFAGVQRDGSYSKLLVKTSDKSDAFVSKLDFSEFDSATGARVLPESVKDGSLVAVKLFLNPRSYLKDGVENLFISRRALQVLTAEDFAKLVVSK